MMPWFIMNQGVLIIISLILMNYVEEYWSERRNQSMFEISKMK